ncbi:septum site-determining protein MinC [Roseomonas sp. SSH11]|uniref:Probable septum site-determining protein MinC n=1 Tax=Pararoseomonas baculiformis TaxID=2820812 RepID=A0ABS4AIZ4_9PROT|nr:septum site-determining protein MinC [Pararoseomonas baculiformis]MBP0446199.1 septum site-determining protein MinC [Pararoseomonas baculiformis]
MSSPASEARLEPFRLRGANFNLLVLRLLDPRVEVIVPALADQFRRAPGFLRNAPIVLGLDDLDPAAAPDFAHLTSQLRSVHIAPIGTTGGGPEIRAAAQAAGLPPLRAAGGDQPVQAAPAPAPEPMPMPEPPPPSGWQPTMVVDQAVRAGQRIWAQGCDLIVRGTVNPGAEVIADGNVHVYGTLRGRAIAGGAENLSARIFALNFEPELVSIAGYYAVRDGLGDAPLGRAVQVCLIGESMRFDKLG